MLIKTQGIVLKHRNIGENDKVLTILSEQHGVIEAIARNAKTTRNALANASQILNYSDFCLYKGKNHYIVNSAETINSFYSLRLDVVKLSIAGYFCELTAYLCKISDENAGAFLKLILNTLHFLSEDKKEIELLKSIFELRIMSISGFMPNLVCCSSCADFDSEPMHLFPTEGILICDNCLIKSSFDKEKSINYPLNNQVLSALRYIIFSDDKRLFSFKLNGISLKQLNYITQEYVMLHTEANFKSLDIYDSLIKM